MTPWEIKGRELINCTCEYGCNCQFNALPDKGHCHAVGAIQIDQGHHGDTKLDGLRIASIFKWPGPIHEGKGEAIAFVDERASAKQRAALLRITAGQDTEPFATMFAVFASTITKMHDPVFTKIEFEVDVDARASALLSALEACRRGGVTGAGFHVVNASAMAAATANGNRRYFRTGEGSFSMTARTPDGTGSGYYAGDHFDLARLNVRQIAEQAVNKAVQSQAPKAIEPGTYSVILEPQAVADLLGFLGNSLDARSAEEGRSAFAAARGAL